MHDNKTILAVLDDLLFTVKINEAAKRVGLVVKFIKSERDAMDGARENPMLMIIDLNAQSVDSVGLILKLKADPETKAVRLLGYVSHVQADLKQRAQEAGCDIVLARSAFSSNLPNLLKRNSLAS